MANMKHKSHHCELFEKDYPLKTKIDNFYPIQDLITKLLQGDVIVYVKDHIIYMKFHGTFRNVRMLINRYNKLSMTRV